MYRFCSLIILSFWRSLSISTSSFYSFISSLMIKSFTSISSDVGILNELSSSLSLIMGDLRSSLVYANLWDDVSCFFEGVFAFQGWPCRRPIGFTLAWFSFASGPSGGILLKGGSIFRFSTIYSSSVAYSFRFFFQRGLVITYQSFLDHFSIRIRSCLENSV